MRTLEQQASLHASERQRGLRSFLTWPFMLMEVTGKGVLTESVAKGAIDDGLSFDRSAPDQDLVISDPSSPDAFRLALPDQPPEEDVASASGLKARMPVASALEAIGHEPAMYQPVAQKLADIGQAVGGGGADHCDQRVRAALFHVLQSHYQRDHAIASGACTA